VGTFTLANPCPFDLEGHAANNALCGRQDLCTAPQTCQPTTGACGITPP